MNKSTQSGFTMIELVMVIVIIGILSAIALPRFIDLSGTARLAALDGIGGALSSASAVNYAARLANPSLGIAITTCADAAGALVDNQLPEGYSFLNGSSSISPGVSIECIIQDTANPASSGTYKVIGVN